jgi:hypothetical protein
VTDLFINKNVFIIWVFWVVPVLQPPHANMLNSVTEIQILGTISYHQNLPKHFQTILAPPSPFYGSIFRFFFFRRRRATPERHRPGVEGLLRRRPRELGRRPHSVEVDETTAQTTDQSSPHGNPRSSQRRSVATSRRR